MASNASTMIAHATTRRRRRRWTAAATTAMVMTVVMSLTSTARGETCGTGCAPNSEIARATRVAAEADKARARSVEESKIAREGLERAKREVKETGVKMLALEREMENVRTTLKQSQSESASLERTLAETREELARSKASDSARVRALEERLIAAEEAWAPVWLRRRADKIVKTSQEQTARAVQFGKEKIPEVVNAAKARTKKVVETSKEHTTKMIQASKERTKKVVDAANEHFPKVVKASREQTTKLVNAGRGVVGKVSQEVGHISEKLTVLKDLKDDLKEARKIHEKKSKTGKEPKRYPEKFSTRQAVRAYELADEFAAASRAGKASATRVVVSTKEASKKGLQRARVAMKEQLERLKPMTERLRTATKKHVGVKLVPYVLAIPVAALQKELSGYNTYQLAERIADTLLTLIATVILLMIVKVLFFSPLDENAATYSIMKVPQENGVDVIIRLPGVESMDEIDFRFDQTFNQIHIDTDETRHSELIVVPRCKIGIKRWARPEPKFLDGEEVLLVELRPIQLRANGTVHSDDIMEPPPPPRQPFAPRNSKPFEPVSKRAAPRKKASTEKVSTRSTRSRR